jgi:Na+/melibiose symporter-like transporter
LNLLYFPIWLAAVFNRHTAFPFRIFKLPLELFLLIVGMGEFMLSSPRVGMLALLMMLGFLFIKAILILYRKLWERISLRKKSSKPSGGNKRQALLKAAIGGISLALILVIFSLVVSGAARLASAIHASLCYWKTRPDSRKSPGCCYWMRMTWFGWGCALPSSSG